MRPLSIKADRRVPYDHRVIADDRLLKRMRAVIQSSDQPAKTKMKEIHSRIRDSISEGSLAPVQAAITGPSSSVIEHARTIRDQFENVVIMGTGGSSLGAQALVHFKSTLDFGKTSGPALYFDDNLNAHKLEALLSKIDIKKTHFLIISKSGRTVETLAQFGAVLARLATEVPASDASRHFTAITDPGDRPLRDLASRYKIKVLDHPRDVGGRFSVFTLVGLLPAAVAGLDIEKIISGARSVVRQLMESEDVFQVPSAVGAMATYLMESEFDSRISVLISYDDRLVGFGRWFRQLWAESLGKNGGGSTPVACLGPLDQHSQLQLFLDGPKDKFFAVISEDSRGIGPKIADGMVSNRETAALGGKAIGDIVFAECQNLMRTLVGEGLALRRFAVENLDLECLGALLMHFMIEIIYLANLCEVDPFNQPAVEKIKKSIDSLLTDKLDIL